MATIYSNSVFTIIAAGSKDANSGIPGVAGQPRKVDIYPIPSCPEISVARRTDFLDDFYRSTSNTRAWTFQERLLSRRCIYLLPSQAYFQCRSEIWSEDRLEPYDGLHLLNPTINMVKKDGVEHVRFFDMYLQLAYEYLSKQLTDPSDIVNAFSGILEHIGKRCGWHFVHCLPIQLFDAALMWCHVDQKPRRRLNGCQTEPSWSWTGWFGRMSYECTVLWGGKLMSLLDQPIFFDPAASSEDDSTIAYQLGKHLNIHSRSLFVSS
jgi:hypothetical protein